MGNNLSLNHSRHVQAVLSLLQGGSPSEIIKRYHICRSTLYKYRERVLTTIGYAVAEQRRGPRHPHNRTANNTEKRIAVLCQRCPSWSSYKIHHYYGAEAPSPRTIQRIRERHGLKRCQKRPLVTHPQHRLTAAERRTVKTVVKANPHLGAERIAWDLQNGDDHLTVSYSTIKYYKRKRREELRTPRPPKFPWRFYERHHPHSLWHGDFMEKVTLTDLDRTAYQLTLLDDYSRGYVSCDLFLVASVCDTIRSLIAAMRQWQTIPTAVIFDNGSAFKGKLLMAFCDNLGIRLIHSAVYHPQTNDKLERSFRDDMWDFYKQCNAWNFETLRNDLPYYVHYRNYVRGHRALDGKPSITRLREQTWMALPCILENLESYACYEVCRKIIPATGSIRLYEHDAYLGKSFANQEIAFFDTLDGLEARIGGQAIAVFREYHELKRLYGFERKKLSETMYFEHYKERN